MLRVSYKNRYGYCTRTLTSADGKKHQWKFWFCRANALCAMVQFYKNEEKQDMVNLYAFFADTKHADACIKDGFLTKGNGYSGMTFFAKNMDGKMWKLVKLMAKRGIKVTIK